MKLTLKPLLFSLLLCTYSAIYGQKDWKRSCPRDVTIYDTDTSLTNKFSSNKGSISMPIDDYISFEIGSSDQKDDSLSIPFNSKNLRKNTLFIECVSKIKVNSIFDGEVTRVIEVDDYYVVLVRHGRYLSVYQYIDELYIKEKQNTKKGQLIGRVKTINSTAILGFEIWLGMNKLNPAEWMDLR